MNHPKVSSQAAPQNASSTGQEATAAEWLDVHFEAFRPEYETCLMMAGLETGWHVLDAGCGSGSFLPLLAGAVGKTGQVSAIDIAPDNVEVARSRIADWDPPCPVEVQHASILELPFPDNHFDAAWIANVFMYLTADELRTALAELHRVVRPGGLICAKEVDGRLVNLYPTPYTNYAPLVAAMGAVFPGRDYARLLPFFYRDAGLEIVKQVTVPVERWSPLLPVDYQYLGSFLSTIASAARTLELDAEAQAFWDAQIDSRSSEAFVNQPDIAFITAQMVAIGRVSNIER
jgi:arsenite methyltransferase